MAQILGRTCALCDERISSPFGAEWCPSCGSPLHRDCKKPGAGGGCPGCGADEAAIAASRRRSAEEAEATRRGLRRHLRRLGLVRLFSGLGCLAFGSAVFLVPYLASRKGHRVVWYGAILFGAVQLVRGVVCLVRASRRGPPRA